MSRENLRNSVRTDLTRVLIGVLIVWSASVPRARAVVQVGDVAPDFTLQDHTGTLHSLSDYRGKCVLLTLIGFSCVRCLSAGPAVEAVWEDFKDSRVFQTVAVDVWSGDVSGVESFISQTGATYPVLMYGTYLEADGEGTYGLRNDNYLVLDAEGIVRYSSNDGPFVTSRYNDTDVRAVIRSYLPVGVLPVTWETVKGLYR